VNYAEIASDYARLRGHRAALQDVRESAERDAAVFRGRCLLIPGGSFIAEHVSRQAATIDTLAHVSESLVVLVEFLIAEKRRTARRLQALETGGTEK